MESMLIRFKKKVQNAGLFRELKMRKAYEKPSEKKARKKRECIRRIRRAAAMQRKHDKNRKWGNNR